MRQTKCLCIKHSFALFAAAALLWIGSPALGQSAPPQDRDTMTWQLSSFDNFLDGHPEIAEQLRKDPSLVNDKKFVASHPDLQNYLQQHSGIGEEIAENPQSFMRQEQRFERQETRRDLANLDQLLDSHPEIAEQLRKDPSLVNDKKFVANHAQLQEFLQAHGELAQEFRQNPDAFMQREQRFDQREDFRDRDRDMTRAQLASMARFLDSHPEVAEDLRRNPSLINNQEFVKKSPALTQYLQQHPGVQEEFSENPNAFMQQEQRFDRQKAGMDPDTTGGEMASMDRFLDSHPEIAEQLRKDPSLVNDKKFLSNHPALQSYLKQNPGVHEEITENPSAFMQQEQGFEGQEHRFNRQAFDQDNDITRGQLASMDRFLDRHPEIAEQLRKDPALVNNKDFVKNHPELQSYLLQHPGVHEEFSENPNGFMHQAQRFDRQEDRFGRQQGFGQNSRFDGDADRREIANFGQFLGGHTEIAQQISKDPSLLNNKEFMENHPELAQYVQTHPGMQDEVKQNPQSFMQSVQQISKAAPKPAPLQRPAQKQQ